ncbi:MAG: aldolase catalytic domain-containing protein [Firmicutes bacterium]|nr:aldolase catalytic domain-containing protein [Bacillota bacterium]
MEKSGVSCLAEKKGTWLTYRPDVKVLDCTIRDGGLVNNFNFDDAFVRAVYQACIDGGVDYMEMGYKASKKIFSPAEFGRWRFCDEDDLRRIVGEKDGSLKLSVMADAERTDYHTDILPKEDSVLDMIRIATYIHQIPAAVDMIKDAHDKGYETTVNLMAISVVQEKELDEALEILAKTDVDVIYLVDSFGSLYSEEIQDLTRKYLKAVQATGKKNGIHTHNNQQLAYANTIEALILGASFLDATIGGLGRGAGNCPMELLLGFLKNPKFHLRPVLKCVQEQIVPLKQKVSWGFDIPYLITGVLNLHPRSAMAFLDRDDRNNYVAFYDSVYEEE